MKNVIDLRPVIEGYELKAGRYAEERGIIEFHVKGNKMIYYASYPLEEATYKVEINLDTFEEVRTKMKRYYIAYDSLIGGRYQANYMD